MEICIFYSWQSLYKNNCNKIIEKALDKAVKDLNSSQSDFQYCKLRGGSDIVGSEHIDNKVDEAIRNKANIAIVDFTHNGKVPERDPKTGEWIKERCLLNSNANNEHGKLIVSLGESQVFTVYNTAYGEMDVNLEPPFDLRQAHHPVPFCCTDSTTDEERMSIVSSLANTIKPIIQKCTNTYIENQKVRFAPLIPMRKVYVKKMYDIPFKKTEAFEKVCNRVTADQSFRLLGLPGLGKTRMVGEAFRGRDIDVYYCDCKEEQNNEVIGAVELLMESCGDRKQTVVLDNCSQRLCSQVSDLIDENGFNCQLITIYYDPLEKLDSGIDGLTIKVEDFAGVVEDMVGHVDGMSESDAKAIISMAGGFPLMATIMMENYRKGVPIVNVSKKDVFERMLGVNPQNSSDQDKLKVLTAFSIFKFIGLYGPQEKQGKFIANNKIVTNIQGTEEENLQLFREVHGQYQNAEILERQGNLVLMRLIPLAIYLCKIWFDKQTIDSITSLINQIRNCPDEGTKNMLIDSLSRRITLLSEVPLAKELSDGLTNPDQSPFLSEEVVLSALGSRLFLAFSEVNPESCAFALQRMIAKKSDEDILAIESARRNLSWALDHLAFDKRSFKNAMLTLARFSLVETEQNLANNTTGLFLDRFKIILSGTEADLSTRVDLLKDIYGKGRYESLIKKALLAALHTGHFYRSGGAEKQGTRVLKDYEPSFSEIVAYYNTCFDMFLSITNTQQDIEDIAKSLTENARFYYMQGMEDFLFKGLDTIAPQKEFVWEEMKDSLSYILEYDARKRNNHRIEDILSWRNRLTKDDYVYRLLHLDKEISRHYDSSFEEEMKKLHQCYRDIARELVDKELYKDSMIMSGIMRGECFHYNSYGMELASYSKEKGVQNIILDIILEQVLHHEVSRDGESLLIYFMLNVTDADLLNKTYTIIGESDKKRLLPAVYAIKSEGEDRLLQLFALLNKGELTVNDFYGYYNYRALNDYDVKYVSNRLLEYGPDGANIVFERCHNLLFGEEEIDEEYQKIGRKCLLSVDLNGIRKNDYVYFMSANNYLVKNHDEELALHIQKIQEISLKDYHFRDTYYLGRLYKKILCRYTSLLKPRLLALLEDEDVRHQWIELMRTSYPQDGESEPIYKIIPAQEWFEWLEEDSNNERAYALAMMFSYSCGTEACPDYLRLLDGYWCSEVRGALSSRFHSYGWTGSGIPLYQNRIAVCEDYCSKLSNSDAKEWFRQDIDSWKQSIEAEILQNAHERAIYD